MVIVDHDRVVDVTKDHINTRAGWSLMVGKRFTGWPVMTILRGEVSAEWADDSPGMRPVGEPRGRYQPRTLGGSRGGTTRAASPTRLPAGVAAPLGPGAG